MHVHESVPPHACKLRSWFSLQFATLSKGILFSEEDCWDFFAENMAPFTSSKTSITELVVSDPTVSDEKMVQTFLRDLADHMHAVKTTKKYVVSLSTIQ